MAMVFLSFASQDIRRATKVATALERFDLKVWYAPRDVTGGANYAKEIVEAIASADGLVVLLTGAALESDDVQTEVSLARAHGKLLIPARMPECPDPLSTSAWRYHLAIVQVIQFAGVDELAASVAHRLRPVDTKHETTAAASPDPDGTPPNEDAPGQDVAAVEEPAIEPLGEVPVDDPSETFAARLDNAEALIQAGDHVSALAVLEGVVMGQEARLGKKDPRTVFSRARLQECAMAVLAERSELELQRERAGTTSEASLRIDYGIATALRHTGCPEQAIVAFKDLIKRERRLKGGFFTGYRTVNVDFLLGLGLAYLDTHDDHRVSHRDMTDDHTRASALLLEALTREDRAHTDMTDYENAKRLYMMAAYNRTLQSGGFVLDG